MKKIVPLILSFTLLCPCVTVTAFATQKTATPTGSKVVVNNGDISFDAYNIDGSNYFKLRDLAKALNGSSKSFDVTWDEGKNAINLISNKSYTIVGGELAKGDGKDKSAQESTASIYIDGIKANLTAYNISGNTYFKLRDIMGNLDIHVGWDSSKNQITIDTQILLKHQHPNH